jgi:hypothetical protein
MLHDVDGFDRPFNVHDNAQFEGHVKYRLYRIYTNLAVEVLY